LVCSTFFFASEVNYKEPNVEHELELERPQLNDLVAECKEILNSMEKIIESLAAKVGIDPEPSILVKPEVVDEAEPEIIDETKT